MVRLWKAFLNTLYGLGWALRYETAVREEFVAFAIAFPVSFFVAPNVAWWLALIGSLMALIIVELLNTAIEKLSDHVTPEHSHAIKVVKDLGSAAVFIALVLAFIIWCAALALRLSLL
ncbi:MAG TPA: diacylglycerol kinase [Xanthobacteraceae bacterium]|nr:diacylglycerol kinase [Xanthobacteraceae bacterium]